MYNFTKYTPFKSDFRFFLKIFNISSSKNTKSLLPKNSKNCTPYFIFSVTKPNCPICI